jgi:rod shape determining protein RodA
MLQIERISRIDWTVVIMCAALAAISLLFIYSSTHTYEQPYSVYFKKQVVGLCIGFGIYFLFSMLDFRLLCRWGYFAYFFIIALLLFTLIKGSIGMGAQRWIDIKIFRFQPSELAKLFLPAFVVYYLQGEPTQRIYPWRTFIPIFTVVIISFALVLKQPDLGTALIIGIAAAVMLWYAGLSKKFFLYTALVGALCTPVLYQFLKPYQRKRIEVFMGNGDVQRERYHVEQSKIAIGSGGIMGKGFLQGTQNRLAFLPERRTDFIFSVLCEEWGLLGATLLLLLYAILIGHLLQEIAKLRDFFAQLLALGLFLPIVLSIIINIGMVIGLLPVVGIPLPLMSYGLTHTWITCAALGWITSITTSRLTHE